VTNPQADAAAAADEPEPDELLPVDGVAGDELDEPPESDEGDDELPEPDEPELELELDDSLADALLRLSVR
jgi:hypothetical protein